MKRLFLIYFILLLVGAIAEEDEISKGETEINACDQSLVLETSVEGEERPESHLNPRID